MQRMSDGMGKLPAVLMVAYYFPPMGGAGVQRTQKFAKYLPLYGWQPYILTVNSFDLVTDSSLMNDLPAESLITRTSYLGLPSRLPWRVRNFIARWLLLVDEQIGWLPFATNAGRKILKTDSSFKVIYSTSTPYTSHLIGRNLHLRTGVPWIADFRDPWIGNPFIKFPSAFHRRLNNQLEENVINDAHRVILNTVRSLQNYIERYSHLPPEKFATIPNGYDQQDIQSAEYHGQTGARLTIVHLGSLYGKTRSSEYFLRALHQVIRAGKVSPEKIRVRFIGIIDKETPTIVKQLMLSGIVDLTGYLPHSQSMKELASGNVLLLFPYYGPGAELSVPAKIYEYLAIKKPILCLADPGACADLVLKARAGSIVPPTDVEKIADKLVEIYQSWENGQLLIQPDMDLISSFERRKLTGQLADLLNEVCV